MNIIENLRTLQLNLIYMIHPICVHLYCLVRLSRRAHTHKHTHTHTHTHRERDVHALEALKSRRHPAVLADGEDNKERKTVVDRCLQGGCETGIREIKRARERMRKRGIERVQQKERI